MAPTAIKNPIWKGERVSSDVGATSGKFGSSAGSLGVSTPPFRIRLNHWRAAPTGVGIERGGVGVGAGLSVASDRATVDGAEAGIGVPPERGLTGGIGVAGVPSRGALGSLSLT